jgi:hypothetical protein
VRLARLLRGELCLVDGDALIDATRALAALPAARYPHPRRDALIAALETLRPQLEAAARAGAAPPRQTLW